MKRLYLALLLILTLAAPVMAAPAPSGSNETVAESAAIAAEFAAEAADSAVAVAQDATAAVEGVEGAVSDLATSVENFATVTTEQLEAGETVGGIFSSSAFLTVLFGLLGSIVTFFGTDGFKLSSSWIKGRKTQLVAATISVLTAGVGGYFGLSEVTGAGPVESALLASLSALSAYLVAVGKHERNRYQETGMRKPERKAGAMVADTVLEGLVIAAKVLPPPFNLSEPLIRNLYATHGAKVVKDLIDQQRALSEAELMKAGDEFEKANPVNPVTVTKTAPGGV